MRLDLEILVDMNQAFLGKLVNELKKYCLKLVWARGTKQEFEH